MSAMRGITIIVSGGDADRLYDALELAAAEAATGASARLFCQGRSVALLAEASPASGDADRNAAGLPTLAELRLEAVHLGVQILACQGGMALSGYAIDRLGPGVEAGGLIGLLADLGEDRLIVY